METLEASLTALRLRMQEALEGPMPECTVEADIPKDLHDQTLYNVPEKFRRKLAWISRERTLLNRKVEVRPGLYYQLSRVLAEDYWALVDELRKDTGFRDEHLLEFHKDWLFSAVTLTQLQLAYEAKQKEKKPDVTAPEEGGLSFAYLDHPPERCHLFDFYLDRNDAEAYSRHVHRKKKTL